MTELVTRKEHLHIHDEKMKRWMDQMALDRGISLKAMQEKLILAFQKMEALENGHTPQTPATKKHRRVKQS